MDRDRPREMTARQRLGLAARRWARRFGRTILWTGMVVVFLWKVPIIPYSPTCTKKHFPPGAPAPAGFSKELAGDDFVIEGPMSTAFVNGFTDLLNYWGVFHLRIGNNVFFSSWDVFTGADSGIANANDKTLGNISNRLRRRDTPPEIRDKAMRQSPDVHIWDDCPLARAVSIENWGRRN